MLQNAERVLNITSLACRLNIPNVCLVASFEVHQVSVLIVGMGVTSSFRSFL